MSQMDQRFADDQTFLESLWSDSQLPISKGSTVSQSNNPAVNDAQYKAEFKAGTYQMTEEQFVSLRRAEDGLEEFIPATAGKPATDPALNPLASGL
jgi:hypothetical protein